MYLRTEGFLNSQSLYIFKRGSREKDVIFMMLLTPGNLRATRPSESEMQNDGQMSNLRTICPEESKTDL